ncbi:MAG TPA: efflux transporter outer membrane subunit [Steroidobacteraceae bacterium]|jgi:NodT family efflux transporter outer membrane factor (OMF) lipoprotein|nr:efflux transporter outer membrane subunit [Steroidobacteraceae bacterium]
MSSILNPWRGLRCIAGCAALLVAGCAVGPSFKPPPASPLAGYSAKPPAATAATPGDSAGAAQRFQPGKDIPADWWRLFHCRSLDTLIAAALKSNPSLQAAQAALRVAREDVLAQRGAYFPAVSAGMAASRQKQSDLLAPTPNYPAVPNEFQYDLFTPELTISYVPDVFGLSRRTVESLRAQEQSARFQMIAAWTTLSANVVATAVQAASLREQVQATRELVELQKRSLAILQLRLQHGDASALDVAAQRSQLAQAEATLPALVKQLRQAEHALAALTGRFPDEPATATVSLSDLHLPEDLPLSLPSALVAQRPDVRQARANLHAASAQIGIAAAQRLPSIQLTADAGSSALAISELFGSGTGFWGIAASLTAPVFQGGQLLHQERAAKAAYVQAAQQYRGTVLAAFQNVADTLAALQEDAQALQAASAAARAAKRTLDLSQLQLQHGYIGVFELLAAEQAYQQARMTLAQDEANRFADTAALYQALGGGWWHSAGLNKP